MRPQDRHKNACSLSTAEMWNETSFGESSRRGITNTLSRFGCVRRRVMSMKPFIYQIAFYSLRPAVRRVDFGFSSSSLFELLLLRYTKTFLHMIYCHRKSIKFAALDLKKIPARLVAWNEFGDFRLKLLNWKFRCGEIYWLMQRAIFTRRYLRSNIGRCWTTLSQLTTEPWRAEKKRWNS